MDALTISRRRPFQPLTSLIPAFANKVKLAALFEAEGKPNAKLKALLQLSSEQLAVIARVTHAYNTEPRPSERARIVEVVLSMNLVVLALRQL